MLKSGRDRFPWRRGSRLEKDGKKSANAKGKRMNPKVVHPKSGPFRARSSACHTENDPHPFPLFLALGHVSKRRTNWLARGLSDCGILIGICSFHLIHPDLAFAGYLLDQIVEGVVSGFCGHLKFVGGCRFVYGETKNPAYSRIRFENIALGSSSTVVNSTFHPHPHPPPTQIPGGSS